jgi:hypothetical protein
MPSPRVSSSGSVKMAACKQQREFGSRVSSSSGSVKLAACKQQQWQREAGCRVSSSSGSVKLAAESAAAVAA